MIPKRLNLNTNDSLFDSHFSLLLLFDRLNSPPPSSFYSSTQFLFLFHVVSIPE